MSPPLPRRAVAYHRQQRQTASRHRTRKYQATCFAADLIWPHLRQAGVLAMYRMTKQARLAVKRWQFSKWQPTRRQKSLQPRLQCATMRYGDALRQSLPVSHRLAGGGRRDLRQGSSGRRGASPGRSRASRSLSCPRHRCRHGSRLSRLLPFARGQHTPLFRPKPSRRHSYRYRHSRSQ